MEWAYKFVTKVMVENENCLEMVGYSEDDKTAGWWNDIPCGRNETRSFVCAYDNGKEG